MDRPRVCTGTTPSMLCMPTLSSVWHLVCLNQLHKLSLLATFAFATENRLEAVELLHSLVHVSTIKESHSLSTRLISRVVKYNFGIHTYISYGVFLGLGYHICMHIYYTVGIGLPCMVYNRFVWVTISPIPHGSDSVPPRVKKTRCSFCSDLHIAILTGRCVGHLHGQMAMRLRCQGDPGRV